MPSITGAIYKNRIQHALSEEIFTELEARGHSFPFSKPAPNKRGRLPKKLEV